MSAHTAAASSLTLRALIRSATENTHTLSHTHRPCSSFTLTCVFSHARALLSVSLSNMFVWGVNDVIESQEVKSPLTGPEDKAILGLVVIKSHGWIVKCVICGKKAIWRILTSDEVCGH